MHFVAVLVVVLPFLFLFFRTIFVPVFVSMLVFSVLLRLCLLLRLLLRGLFYMLLKFDLGKSRCFFLLVLIWQIIASILWGGLVIRICCQYFSHFNCLFLSLTYRLESMFGNWNACGCLLDDVFSAIDIVEVGTILLQELEQGRDFNLRLCRWCRWLYWFYHFEIYKLTRLFD